MPSLNLQFHALPADIAAIVQAAIGTEPLHIVIKGGMPFMAKLIAINNLEAEISKVYQERFSFTLYLLKRPPVFGAATGLKFLDINPGGVFIDIGSLSNVGLKQSALSVMDGYPEMYVFAKKIAKQLRKVTTAGVTAVNIDAGIMKLNRNHRYTAAAKELESKGVAMLPFAGGGKLVLGDVTNIS